MSGHQSVASGAPSPHRGGMRRDSVRVLGGAVSGPLREDFSPDDATERLLANKENEYQRYVAARAVRAIKESDDEKPSTGTLRQLTRQAGGQERWRRSWPALLRAIAPPRDPELPDDLQSPLPPHSRWLMDTRSNVLFNVFTRNTNPVEDFYLIPLDDMWRCHRYGVYGLRYKHYPNPGSMAVPRDGSGLYYRPNRKILEKSEGARPARRPGLVTLEHVKRVATRAVGQFFPHVHKDANFFDSWPHIDEVLGCAIEYFHHYFELRRLEEAMEQLECKLYNSGQLDGRRHRMNLCVSEFGRIYSTYLLGYGLKFHHLQQGAGYKSAAASDRQIFEALNAFVAQCVWIVYRRPNVTVIARELGRLFRTAGFDPSRRAVPPPLDHVTSARTLVPPDKSNANVGKTTSKEHQGTGESHHTAHEHRPGHGERRGALGGSMHGASRRKHESEASTRRGTGASSGRKYASATPGASQHQDSVTPQPDSRQATRNTSARSHAADKPSSGHPPSGNSESTQRLDTPGSVPSGSADPAARPISDVHPEEGDVTASPEPQALQTPSIAVSDQQAPEGDSSGGGGGGSAAPPPPAGGDTRSAQNTHVSMKKVYGLYTGPPPPQCAVYGLLRNTSPLLRQSLSHRLPEPAAEGEDESLRVDRTKVGILGTPLQNYDDVLAAIDYEREEKEKRLQFLGPSSTRAGVSRVAGVVPYLLLPSKFFSPDA